MTCIPLWKEVACLVARIGVPELKSHDGHQRSVELCCAWGSHKLLYDTELHRQEQAFLNACPSRVKLTNIHRRDPPTQEALKRGDWGAYGEAQRRLEDALKALRDRPAR